MKNIVAIVGCGRIAQVHLHAMEKIEGLRVKYACDLIEEKALKAKNEYSFVENAITDYNVALNDPEVQAVWVLTPNYAHYTVTMDALRAGKHVFCEKPITVNYALSCEMAEEASKRGLMLNIGVCNRYHASVEKLAEMNKEGKFGNIYHVYCSFRNCRSIPGLGGAFTTKSQSGGGVLIDWGVHFLDLILYVLGGAKLENLTCDAYNEIAKDMKTYKHKSEMWASETSDIENGTNDVDDFISGYVRTDKASISFNGAWAQNLEKNEMFVDFLGDKGGARLSYGKQFTFFDGETLETTESDHEIPNMFRKEDIAFLESCENGIKTKSNIANVLETAKLLDYLYRSADIRKEVQC
ncbi:MAG: Gfo/Idh/MocA family oxidoreductase [Ruminococcaceae bacterium]|nr:Gfo/Idh/MocA family oxidoreductase [Oscillospiraceae bacterium]